MKKSLIIILSICLLTAFAMPAAAVDVKFSGLWYMSGNYVDNPSLLDKGTTAATDGSWANYRNRGAESFYAHKLQLKTTFQVVEGLALNTQFDALTGTMGDNGWAGGGLMRQSQGTTSRQSNGVLGSMLRENIEFAQAWVDFKVPVGRIQAGYVAAGGGVFGTSFGNDFYPWPTIRYDNTFGPVSIFTSIFKIREWTNANAYGRGFVAATSGAKNDSDGDAYRLGGVFKFKAGEAGLMYEFYRDARAKAVGVDGTGLNPAGNNGWITQINTVNPYAKLKFGPAYIEAEGWYRFGSLRKYETFAAGVAQEPNADLSAWAAYIKGQVNIKNFFAGASFVYMSGDDMQSKDKVTGSIAQSMGDNYVSPVGTLVLWNYDLADTVGPMPGNTVGSNPRTAAPNQIPRYMDNVWFYQLFAGFNPTAKMNITAKVSYATADKKPKMGIGTVGATLDATTTSAAYIGQANREFVGDKYGTEADLTASYKIFDNLTYSAGFGYLWAGDYFKGFDNTASVKDNYLVTHKLTLAF